MLDPTADLNGSADDELQLGPDVLLAPVLTAGANTVDVAFPPGRWQNIWTGEVFGDESSVIETNVDAQLGQPALFVRAGTTAANDLAGFAAD